MKTLIKIIHTFLFSLSLHQFIRNSDKFPKWYFILGDNAFPASHYMLVIDGDDDYNFEQISNRIPIECSFGILVNKWAI